MTKNSQDVVIVNATRTGIGKFNGMWGDVHAHELGKIVIKDILKQTSINADEIDEVILGQVLISGAGQNPARQASVGANIPYDKISYIVNQVCGSGLRAIVSAYQSILLNSSKLIIAGGQESMSNCDKELMMKDGLVDAFNNYHMGVTAENVAEKWNISREEQDNFSLSSQQKAQDAIQKGKFEDILSRSCHLIKYYSDSPFIHEIVGTAFFNRGKKTIAVKHFKKLIKLQPMHPHAYNKLGSTLIDLKEYREAKTYLKKSIEFCFRLYLYQRHSFILCADVYNLFSKIDHNTYPSSSIKYVSY